MLMPLLVACEQTGTTIPDRTQVESSLTAAGYSVELTDSITTDSGATAAQRLVAHKGDEYIDICYDVDAPEGDEIMEYYQTAYPDLNKAVHMGDRRVVFCVSSQKSMEDVGIVIVEVKI